MRLIKREYDAYMYTVRNCTLERTHRLRSRNEFEVLGEVEVET